MSGLLILWTVASVGVMAALWFLLRPLPGQGAASRPSGFADLQKDALASRHTLSFPVIRRVTSQEDEDFLSHRPSAAALKRWRGERRRIVRQFLHGLAEDFTRVDLLARMVAAVSPHVEHREELDRIWLGIKFRLLYRTALLRLVLLRTTPVKPLQRLTEVLAHLSHEIDAGMARLEVSSQ